MLQCDHQLAWEISKYLGVSSENLIWTYKKICPSKGINSLSIRTSSLRSYYSSLSFEYSYLKSCLLHLFILRLIIWFSIRLCFTCYCHGINLKMEAVTSENSFSWKNIINGYSSNWRSYYLNKFYGQLYLLSQFDNHYNIKIVLKFHICRQYGGPNLFVYSYISLFNIQGYHIIAGVRPMFIFAERR